MDDDGVILGGKLYYANNGIIGIGPDGATFGGYDDSFGWSGLTKDEKIELAELMIERWTNYKKAAEEVT